VFVVSVVNLRVPRSKRDAITQGKRRVSNCFSNAISLLLWQDLDACQLGVQFRGNFTPIFQKILEVLRVQVVDHLDLSDHGHASGALKNSSHYHVSIFLFSDHW